MKYVIAIGLIGLISLGVIVLHNQKGTVILKNGSLTFIIDGDGAISLDLSD